MNIANMSDIKATSFLIPPINSFLDMVVLLGIGWVDYHEMWKQNIKLSNLRKASEVYLLRKSYKRCNHGPKNSAK